MTNYILSILLSLKLDKFVSLSSDVSSAVKGEEGKIAHDLSNFSLSEILSKFSDMVIDFAFRIAIAIIVFYLGKFIIKRIHKITKSILIRRKVELSLATFILSLLKVSLLFMLIIIVIGILGIETSSFIAIFASAGVAIGMALSGTLQNFAGGVLILLIKPYKIGDFIEVQNYSGTVKEIQIFYTVLNTFDNKSIIIPNGSLSTGTINNYSKESYRRVDWKISIAYGDDINVAKKTALDILSKDNRVVKEYTEEQVSIVDEYNIGDPNAPKEAKKKCFLKRLFGSGKNINVNDTASESKFLKKKTNRAPFVALGELSDSSINIVIRAWTKSENYWGVYFDVNEKIYTEFPKAGLNFPFPQMDLHINQNIK